MKQVTVIGSSGEISPEVRGMAQDLGRRIAERGALLVCGGRDGVMEAVCQGAKETGGLTLGILPGSGDDANKFVDIKVVTEMSDGRNVINVKSGETVIVVAGAAGTLSEVGFALKAKKRVVALKPSGGVAEMLAGTSLGGQRVESADSVEEAIQKAFE